MAHPIFPLMISSIIASTPVVDLNAQSKDPIALAKTNPNVILIARECDGPADGADPHGRDPHDEVRSKPDPHDLPEREHRDDHKQNQDPYNGQYPQGRAPY